MPHFESKAKIEQHLHGSADLAAMYRAFLDRIGYDVDLDELRRDFPELAWSSFVAWVRAARMIPLNPEAERSQPMTAITSEPWPSLPYQDWKATKQTFHRYTQIVGKVRMALVPFRNHWWHVTLLPDTRGLTTGPMPYGDRWVEIVFDLLDHRLQITTSDGQDHGFGLGDRPACADFYRDIFAGLHELGVEVDIRPEPFDLGDSPPFPEDTINDSYDAAAVTRFWQILNSTTRVLGAFSSRFVGKQSPIHLFWHSFDLAHARFSGRRSPVPEAADPVTAEAYSHEVIAFGFWPGDERGTPYPAFYSYTAPEAAGLRDNPLEPADAAWQDTGSGSLAVLPYETVRAEPDPRRALLAFYESAYQGGGRNAGWDTEALVHDAT